MIKTRKKNVAKNQELYDKIKKILVKKAEGYFYDEESLEYVQKPQKEEDKQLSFDDFTNKKTSQISNNELCLVKKKVTSHYIPPDMIAIKILLENFGENMSSSNLENMSEEELIDYKNKLIESINKLTKENKNDN